LLAGLKKAKATIPNFYQDPLAVFLVNSVNEKDKEENKEKEFDQDLKLLFNELLRFAQKIEPDLFDQVKEELIKEFRSGIYTLGEGDLAFMEFVLQNLNINDIYNDVYNSNGSGSLEYYYWIENEKEVALKHTAGNKPFALIKLGTTKNIMKGFLSNYSETMLYNDPKWFENLNESNSPFNLLIGSRAFYEGWDSPRPNVIVFINLEKQSDAKKFVLQAIGRGVRIEPLENERQRLDFLLAKRGTLQIQPNNSTKALESLFVFGTQKEAIETVLQEINRVKSIENWEKVEFKKNDQTEGKLLLIPNYKQVVKRIYELTYPPKFTLSQENYELLHIYLNLVPEKKVCIGKRVHLF
jgi:hypothetical protein